MKNSYSQLEFCQVEQVPIISPKKIHIIRSEQQGAFKVVLSSRGVAQIVSELQKGNPRTLSAYMSFGGTNDTKWTILNDCKEYSLHGDWIADNAAVREYLNSQLNVLVN
ncbi:MAG: hypothetical protein IM526_02305 [Microcystis sp. M38BS1]|uniref:hypothetical protein n=1 Tax=Microcystis sp. M38BS1 TaxID=2771188 RepID=UPI0031FCEAD9|nr:hypothetical protein [Microcystis sp. M38BS1]MCA6582485.1 hypothetical protein [Pseudanabaena sp. M34BS1SP1A06MG]